MELIAWIHPHKIVDRPDGARDHDYMIKWGKYIEDPRQIRYFTPKMAGIWIKEQELAKKQINKIEIPLLFIEAELDVLVSNKAI